MTKDSSSSSSSGGGSQPAEAEYLSARCVLFTYFQGSIGDVVDEHFSRALGQSGACSRETKPALRVTQQLSSSPLPGALWKGTLYPHSAVVFIIVIIVIVLICRL